MGVRQDKRLAVLAILAVVGSTLVLGAGTLTAGPPTLSAAALVTTGSTWAVAMTWAGAEPETI